LRSLLEQTLPTVLETYRADRHPFEAEVVDAADKALGELKLSLEGSLKTASETQSQITAPSEKAKREAAKAALQIELNNALVKMGETTQRKRVALATVEQANALIKETKKALSKASAALQKATGLKTKLTSAIAVEFESLRSYCSSSMAGKKALKAIVALGKQHRLEQTLLSSFSLACKKKADSRSEFDNLMFKEMACALERKLAESREEVIELETAKARREAEAEGAQKGLEGAQNSLTTAEAEIKDAKSVVRDVRRNLDGAASMASCIWSEMKEACDAVDIASLELKTFIEDLLPKFQRLQNNDREPVVAESADVET